MQQHTAFLFPKTIFQGGYLMKKRIISMLLVLITVLGMFPTAAFAAATEEEALGEVDIYNSGYELSYLSINGRIREQIYTYYNYVNSKGQTKEIPAYCINPNTKGVPQSVPEGESIEYLAENITSDPKIMGIIANGYPHRGLSELKLENKYQAYYATKMALWCYLLPNWDIANLKVNPTLTDVEMERAQKILAAAKNIYQRGTAWSTVLAPKLTATPDRDEAYAITINGADICDVKSGRSMTLEPMNPYERRIVHSTVQTVNGATSKSIGSEPNRKVVISPIEGAKPRGERKFRDGKGDRRQGRGNRAPRESQKVIVAPNEQPKNDVSSLSLYGRIDLD